MSRSHVLPIRAGCLILTVAACAVSPAAAQTQAFDQIGVVPGPAEMVRVHGDFAYTVLGRTIGVVDISNPAAPRKRGSHTFPDKVWGIRLVGSLLYAAVDKHGLAMLDVTNPDALSVKGVFKTPGQAKSVALVGTTALVADHMAGVNFIDVSDPAKPVSRGSYFLDGYARAVASSGSVAAAVDAPTGLYLFDFSNPARLEPVSTEQSAERPGSVELMEPAGGKGPRIAVLVGGGSIQLYDIGDPASPKKLSVFKTPSGRPQRAAVTDRMAYVADGPEGLQVVDLANPAAPRIAGGHKTPFPARDVAVKGPLVLVVVAQPSAAETPPSEGSLIILRPRS
jgi:hypothetical protein